MCYVLSELNSIFPLSFFVTVLGLGVFYFQVEAAVTSKSTPPRPVNSRQLVCLLLLGIFNTFLLIYNVFFVYLKGSQCKLLGKQ